jgi:protein SCO1
MKRNRLFYILFFVGLFVAFVAAMSMLIPGFTSENIPPISQVTPFTFTTQDGKTFTEKDMKGKVTAVEYFFTTCNGICPRMNNNMRVVYNQFKDEKDFLILSHTCDPATDTPEKLKRFADSMQVNTAQWVFLTGRKDSLYNMARHTYKIDDPANNLTSIEDDFLHTQFVALVNRQGDVVKIYDALKPSEMKQMAGEIKKLLTP